MGTRRAIVLVAAAASVLALAVANGPSANAAPASTPATAITLDQTSVHAIPGTNAQITGDLTPNTSNAAVYYQVISGPNQATSGGPHACTVSSGSFTCNDTFTANKGADSVTVFADNDGSGTLNSGDVSQSVAVTVAGATIPATALTAGSPAPVDPGTNAAINGVIQPSNSTADVRFQITTGPNAAAAAHACTLIGDVFTCNDTFTANSGTDTVRVFADNAGLGTWVSGDVYQDVTVTVKGAASPGTGVTAGPATQTVRSGTTAVINGTVTPANAFKVYYAVYAGANRTPGNNFLGYPCTVTSGGALTCNDTRTSSQGTDTVRVFVDNNGNGSWDNGDPFADVSVHEAVTPFKVALTPATGSAALNTCSSFYTVSVTDATGAAVSGASVDIVGSEKITSGTGTLSMCTPAVAGTQGTAGFLLGIGAKPSVVQTSVTTGSDGTTRINFTSDSLGPASIAASIGSSTAAGTLTIVPGGTAAVTTLTAAPTPQTAAGGQAVTFTVTATTSSGAPVGGVVVHGRLETGSASGTAAVSCGTTSTGATPGQVACSYTTGTTAGTDHLTFWVDEACGTAGVFDTCEPHATGTVTVTVTTPPASTDQYTALTPFRIVDTRSGLGALTTTGQKLAANKSYTFQFQPSATLTAARAVALNITAVHPTGAGNLRVYSACPGSTLPGTALITYQPNADIANFAVLAKPSCGLTFYSDGAATDVTVDLVGYFTDGYEGLGGVPTSNSVRLLDSRTILGPKSPGVPGNSGFSLPIGGTAAVPAGAKAVLLNVTAVDPKGLGNLRVYPESGSTPPTAANINYIPHVTKSAWVIVALPATGTSAGKVDFYTDGAYTHVVIDAYGYLDSDATAAAKCGWGTGACHGSTAVLSTPTRALDTRPGGIAANTPFNLKVTGTAGIPVDAKAVLVSVASIHPATGIGNLRVYPTGGTVPQVSTVNYVAKTADIANFAIVAIGTGGQITLYSDGSAVNAAVDIVGYVPAAPPATG